MQEYIGPSGRALEVAAFDENGLRAECGYPLGGFAGAFNVGRDFWAKDVIGIDVGCALLIIENYRTGLPWERFMKLPAIHNAMTKAGFRSP